MAGIHVTNNGEIVVQGDYLKERLDWAQKVNSTILWMQQQDLWAILRPNQHYGGIMFHREIDYEEGTEKPKRIGYVLAPNGEVHIEQLDRFDRTTGKFESVITAEFPPMLLTARSGPHPRAQLLWWLPPSEGNREMNKREQMQTLINMVHSTDQEAKAAKQQYYNAIRELNSIRKRLRDEDRNNEELRNKIDAMQPEIVSLRHRIQAMQIERVKDEETLRQVLKQAEENGKYRGKHGIEFARAVVDDIYDFIQKAKDAAGGASEEQLIRRLDLIEAILTEKKQSSKAEAEAEKIIEKKPWQNREEGEMEIVSKGAT